MGNSSNIDKFKYQGFVDMGSSFLSAEEINKLSELVKNKFETISQSHPDYQLTGMKVIQNLLEHVPFAGVAVNKIVSNPLIKDLLEEVLGKDYKIWNIAARRACPGDPGLFLHQDGVGEVNMFLSLDDNLEGEGASMLLPSSHLAKTSMKKGGLELPPVLLNLLSFMVTPLAGLRGSVSIFSNRTWHGRSRNSSQCNHDVIMIGFFTAGYSYGTGISAELTSAYSGTELGSLLATPSDLSGTITSNCEYREAGEIECFDGKTYSLNIENHETLSKIKKPLKLILSVMGIRFVMFFVPMARWLRKAIER